MSSLREWKTEDRIRYTGITHSQARGFYDVRKNHAPRKPDFVQINYSVMEPCRTTYPAAGPELRMAVIINRPFGGGGLFGPGC
jgi:diketogulonate reductase-like aldo/keto reductase